jgi:hypothetical protein
MITPYQVRRSVLRHTNKWGEDVDIQWEVNSGGSVSRVTGEYEGGTTASKSITVKAVIHMISATAVVRQHAEIEAGDAMAMFPGKFYEITDAGDTALTIGDVIYEIAFIQANGVVSNPAVGTEVFLRGLENLSFVFGASHWTQKSAGDGLSMIWNALVGGERLGEVVLMSRAKDAAL